MISAQQIKELRERTGAGISDIKKALEEAKGDMARAVTIIERKLGSSAGKRAGRETKSGIIDSYVHGDKIGVLLEVFCETDFVARNPVFREFVHSLSMHIAAMHPVYLSLDAVPRDVWQTEKDRFTEDTAKLNKSAAIMEEIINGKLKAHFGAYALMEQSFVKDQDKTVGKVLNEVIGKFGENINIGRFVRLEM